MIGKLIQRRTDAAQKRRETAGHVRAAIWRREHDEAADAPRQILSQCQTANDPAHAVSDYVDAALTLVAIEPAQQFRKLFAVPLDRRPQARVAPIDHLPKMVTQRFGQR